MQKVNIPIFVPHAGCTHACVFCNQKHITGQTESVTAQTVRSIVDDSLKTIKPQTHVEIAFFGGSFTAIDINLQCELLGAAQEYIKSGQVNGIRISTRPDCIDGEILQMLKSYGVTTIELGAQSTSDEVLLLCKRGHTKADIFDGARAVSQAGFELGLQMMLGLPGDTPERAIQTAKDIISLKPACTRIYPTLVIADSPLCEMYNCGDYTPIMQQDAVDLCARVYGMFIHAGVDVLRMGLMASESLQSGNNIVAGPFHPAFGELVASKIYFGKIYGLLEGFEGDRATLFVHPAEVSKAVGNRRENVEKILYELNVKLTIKTKENIEVGDVIW